MRTIRLVVVSLLLAGAIAACERVVDLTPPPDAGAGVPDAAISSFDDASLPPDAGAGGPDGNDASLVLDAAPDAF